MDYHRVVTRNPEHLLSGVYLWSWIYYDFAFIFPHKSLKMGSNSMVFNSTSHGIMCLLLLWLFRFRTDEKLNHESKLSYFMSFSNLALPFVVHFFLSMFIIHRIDNELILPKQYEYISPNWLKYVIRTYLVTFVSIEALLLLRRTIRDYVSGKLEILISIICYFMLIFTIRILFHVQISLD